MTTRSRKLLAFTVGAAALSILTTVGVAFRKDIYCYLFLDPRLVGRWKFEEVVSEKDTNGIPSREVIILEFDDSGELKIEKTIRCASVTLLSRYRVEGEELIGWSLKDPNGNLAGKYRIDGDRLAIDFDAHHATEYYRRIPQRVPAEVSPWRGGGGGIVGFFKGAKIRTSTAPRPWPSNSAGAVILERQIK